MNDAQKKTVVLDGDVHANALALFSNRPDIQTVQVGLEDRSAFSSAMIGANGVLIRSARLTSDIIASANGLQVVSRHGVGYDRVDIVTLTARKIPLMVTGTANGNSTMKMGN